MIRLSFLILLFALFLNACNQSPTSTGSEKVEIEDSTVVVDTVHSTENSVNWIGTYEGTLEINGKRSVVKIELDKEGNWTGWLNNEKQTGKFEWMENGSVVWLKESRKIPSKFFVGENFMTQLDVNGHRISDDLDGIYTLNKIN